MAKLRVAADWRAPIERNVYEARWMRHADAAVPGADGVHVVHSPFGHDGFLVEEDQVGEVARKALARARAELDCEPLTDPR